MARQMVNICGAHGSGKTHLSKILKKFKSKTKLIIKAQKINDDFLEDLKLFDCLIIDDYDKNYDEKIIYSIFNLVDQDNKRTMLINSLVPIKY